MTAAYHVELQHLGDTISLPGPSTPKGEGMRWWVDRVQRHAYVGLREELPSPQATGVLRDLELIAETPGAWAFAVRTPHIPRDIALRRNAWALVAAVVGRYAPAAIDRISAVRLSIGEEAITPTTYVRHAANSSRWDLQIMDGYSVILRPDADLADTTDLTLGTSPPVSLRAIGAAALLTSIPLTDLRDHLDTVIVWLRTLVVGQSALERAFGRHERPVVLKRMGDLARDAGNPRLADTINKVLAANSRALVSRHHTGVGRQFVVPRYVSIQAVAASPWLERHRVRVSRALEITSTLLVQREANLPRLSAPTVLAIVRAAKIEDTYHSTTIEGYRISREEVLAVIAGTAYNGRTPADTERLMALKGYARAFDWTLARIGEASPSVKQPQLSESLILDLFIELWSPSIDAGVTDAPTLRDWRNHAVQINGSDHVPPPWEKLRSLVTQFVTQLNAADVGPVTRAVVAHWGIVHLHPFKDGNGRVARLLMNYVLGLGGLPWTTIRADERDTYFAALERAHVDEDLEPFARFVADALDRSYREHAW